MWRDGALLVVRKGEAFPDRCVKSNRPAHGRRVPQTVEKGQSLLFLVHLWNPIAGILLAKSVRKSVTFAVGLSDEWYRKRRRVIWLAGGIIVAALAAVAWAVTSIGRADIALWVLPFGILATLGGLVYGLSASTLVTAKRITNRYCWLGGVHPDFLAALPEWPSEARAEFPGFLDTSE